MVIDRSRAILKCVEVHRLVTEFLGSEPVFAADDLEQGQPAAVAIRREDEVAARNGCVGAADPCVGTRVAPQQPPVIRGEAGEASPVKEDELLDTTAVLRTNAA